ncbi:MAG: NADH-quinone oxidoreductase subunit J [Planctomycetes bacterium]|nr:NADH-quinone oxidoreductase subunit J [Planctomycetota bacterium]MBL7007414.1 NADH-quinone oxidoreductase subunit J [Planctomycetota bacterium]
MAETVSFFFFAAITIGCALLALLHRNVVNSAFSLLGTLLGLAGFYVMLGADFLAMTQVLIYAGGILVLIIFGLMLTQPDTNERRMGRILAAVAVVGTGALAFWEKIGVATWNAVEVAELGEPGGTVREIGLEFLRRDSWLLPFEFASIVLLAGLVGSVYIARRRFREEEL